MLVGHRNTSNTLQSRTAWPLSDNPQITQISSIQTECSNPGPALLCPLRYALICEIGVICGCVPSNRKTRAQPRANSLALGRWHRYRHDDHRDVSANVFLFLSWTSMARSERHQSSGRSRVLELSCFNHSRKSAPV